MLLFLISHIYWYQKLSKVFSCIQTISLYSKISKTWLQSLWTLESTSSIYILAKYSADFLFKQDVICFSLGFPGSSAGKESACNAGDTSSIPGSGRSAGEGIDYPLQYSWASLVAETVKNPPAVQETWVRCLDWEDLLKEGMATHSSILAWRIPMDRGAWRATVCGVAKSWTQLSD